MRRVDEFSPALVGFLANPGGQRFLEIELDLDGFQPYLIVIGQCALPVEILLLVNKTFDLLQEGVIGRRFSHVNHLADSSESFSGSLSGFGSVDGGSLAGNDCSMVSSSAASRRSRSRSGRGRLCRAAAGSVVMHASQMSSDHNCSSQNEASENAGMTSFSSTACGSK